MNAILTTNPLHPSFNKPFIYNLLMNVRRERKGSVFVKIIKRHILLSIRSSRGDGTIVVHVSTRSISNGFNQNVGSSRFKVTIQQKLLSLIISAFYFIAWRKMIEDNFTCTWCLGSQVLQWSSKSGRLAFQSDLGTRKFPTQNTHAPDISRHFPRSTRVLTHSRTWPLNMQIYWSKRKYSHNKKAQLQQPLVWYVQVEVFCQFPVSSPDALHSSPPRSRHTANFRFYTTVAITSSLVCERDKQQPEIRLHLLRLLLSLHETGN